MRHEAGFRSSYAFWRDNGGKKMFPFSDAYYAKIERGSALPRPGWVPTLLASLRRPTASGSRRDLIAAFLKDAFGNDALFDETFAKWLRVEPAPPAPVRSLRRIFNFLLRNLSIEETDVLLSGPGAFWSFICLSKSREPLSLEELVGLTGLTAAQLRSGLETLRARAFAKRGGDGRWSSPLLEGFSSLSRHGRGADRPWERIRAFVERSPRPGKELLSRFVLLRAGEPDIRRVCGVLDDAFQCAFGSVVDAPGEDTGIFYGNACLRRISIPSEHAAFPSLLAAQRAKRGHDTAYSFYQSCGGRRLLPFTYALYARAEAGRALPPVSALPVLLSALDVPASGKEYRALLSAYLRETLADDAFFDDLVSPWLEPEGDGVFRLPDVPAAAVAPDALWAFLHLACSDEPMSCGQIAEKTGLSSDGIAKGLALLLSRKLVRRVGKARFRAAPGRFFASADEAGQERFRKLLERAPLGREVLWNSFIIRAERKDMLLTAQSMTRAVEAAEAGKDDAAPGLFALEVCLKEVFPF
jgi:hypothetical protein